jgi:triacylglycerol lipase
VGITGDSAPDSVAERVTVDDVSVLAPFLHPDGFSRPPLAAVLRESSVVAESGRYVLRSWSDRRARCRRPRNEQVAPREGQPVVLVPGFMAGDGSLSLLGRTLRGEGFRTYGSHIHANVGCTVGASALLEQRIEWIAQRRGSRVQVVGHSLGGMLARGLAVRRPDLVAGIVTLGSPMLAPAAHHATLTHSLEVLVRLGRAGVPGLMSEDCVGGSCARASFEETRAPMPEGVTFTAVYSRRDGIVDWRACIDPLAHAVEVTVSHTGMAVDPRVADVVLTALRSTAADGGSVLEVDCGVGA